MTTVTDHAVVVCGGCGDTITTPTARDLTHQLADHTSHCWTHDTYGCNHVGDCYRTTNHTDGGL